MSNNVVPLKKLETSNPYEELKSAYQSEIEQVDFLLKRNFQAISSLLERCLLT